MKNKNEVEKILIDHGFYYDKDIFDLLTIDDIKEIRKFRINGCSWRKVAEKMFNKSKKFDWEPIDNQLIGQELCLISSLYFDEDYWDEPWN